MRSANFLLSVNAVDAIAWGVAKIANFEVLIMIDERSRDDGPCYVVAAMVLVASEVAIEFFASALTPFAVKTWCRSFRKRREENRCEHGPPDTPVSTCTSTPSHARAHTHPSPHTCTN